MKKLFVSKKFILTTLLTALAGFLTFRFIGYYRGKMEIFEIHVGKGSVYS